MAIFGVDASEGRGKGGHDAGRERREEEDRDREREREEERARQGKGGDTGRRVEEERVHSAGHLQNKVFPGRLEGQVQCADQRLQRPLSTARLKALQVAHCGPWLDSSHKHISNTPRGIPRAGRMHKGNDSGSSRFYYQALRLSLLHNAYLLTGGGMSGAHVPFRSRLYISGCIIPTGCSIAVDC